MSDIQGMEDHLGDMDFKVAGTPKGITALQMDIKIDGLSKEIFEEALAQAKIGRAQILENMLSAISEVRSEVGRYAPKIHQMHIPVDKIPDVIGPKGKMINQIIEACNDVQIDIEDDGKVIIYHMDKEPIEHAAAMIEDVIREAKVGDVFEGEVVRIESFGAFVHLFSSTDGLLHISEISHERVEKVEDALKLGDKVKVKVIKIDNKGRVNVSAKALLKRPKKEKKAEPKKETAETAVSEGEAKEA